jgi:hypothetical protein
MNPISGFLVFALVVSGFAGNGTLPPEPLHELGAA